MNNWLKIRENIWLLITVFICIVIIVAHSVGWIEDSRVLGIVLIILCSFSISDSIEKRKIRNDLKTIIKSINGISVQLIPSHRELYRHILKRVKEGKQTWDILSFSGYNKNINIWPEKKDYQQAMLNAVNNNLVVRRNTAICNKAHLSHLIERMKDYQGKNYFVVGFLKKEQSVPMFNIIIIDKEEVILWLMQEPGVVSWGTGGCISIKHPHVAEKFNQYYTEVWSRNSNYVLKDENSIYEDDIENLGARLQI